MKNIATKTNLLRLATAFFLAFTMMGGITFAQTAGMLVTGSNGEIIEVNDVWVDLDAEPFGFVDIDNTAIDMDSDYSEDVDTEFIDCEPMDLPKFDDMGRPDDMTYTTISHSDSLANSSPPPSTSLNESHSHWIS